MEWKIYQKGASFLWVLIHICYSLVKCHNFKLVQAKEEIASPDHTTGLRTYHLCTLQRQIHTTPAPARTRRHTQTPTQRKIGGGWPNFCRERELWYHTLCLCFPNSWSICWVHLNLSFSCCWLLHFLLQFYYMAWYRPNAEYQFLWS